MQMFTRHTLDRLTAEGEGDKGRGRHREREMVGKGIDELKYVNINCNHIIFHVANHSLRALLLLVFNKF